MSTKCPAPTKATSDGVFAGQSPVDYALPLLTIQLLLIVSCSRIFEILLKPLRQPRVIAEVLGGIFLGASVLGNIPGFTDTIFPKSSLTVLTTVANMGLLYFLFMVGLELDTKMLMRVGKSAMAIAAAGMIVPFVAGIATSFACRSVLGLTSDFGPFLVFMGVAMSITAFPVLARILAERRLLTTDVGQMAISAAAVDDVVAWILLALAVALTTADSPISVLWIILCTIAFVAFMFTGGRWFMRWLTRGIVDNEPIPEWIVAITLVGVMLVGFVTDVIGIHGIFGAFIFGLCIPKEGPFANLILEKIEDLTRIVLLPLFFAAAGLNVRFGAITGPGWGLLVLVIFTACFGKIAGITCMAMLHKMPFRKSLVLGVLMNTKGLVELIVLNIGLSKGVINEELYTIMVIMALVTTFMTTPIVMTIFKPARDPVPHIHTNLEAVADQEARMMVCVQGMRNLTPMLNLMELARGTRRRPLKAYLLHLQEYSERSSSIMLVTKARKDGKSFFSSGNSGSRDQVVVAFQTYAQLSKVNVQPMTVIGTYENMHEEICDVASDKRSNIIIMPYHKSIGQDGNLVEPHNPAIQNMTEKILEQAPCSVAILVDRGFGGAAQESPDRVNKKITVLFFGGADDREALTLAKRMAEHPGVAVTVLRFRPASGADVAVELPAGEDFASASGEKVSPLLSVSSTSSAEEEKLDELALESVKLSTAKTALASSSSTAGSGPREAEVVADSGTLVYEERELDDPSSAILGMGKTDADLIIVGRSHTATPLVALMAAQRTPSRMELGPVGDMLAHMEMASSLLVVRQHKKTVESSNLHKLKS